MSKPALSLIIGLAAMVIATLQAEAHGPLLTPAPDTISTCGTQLTLGLPPATAARADPARQ